LLEVNKPKEPSTNSRWVRENMQRISVKEDHNGFVLITPHSLLASVIQACEVNII